MLPSHNIIKSAIVYSFIRLFIIQLVQPFFTPNPYDQRRVVVND